MTSLNQAGPHSILIVGCGLIGVSIAKCLRRLDPEATVDGVETNTELLRRLETAHLFDNLHSELPQGLRYDIAVLCTPIRAACGLLPHTAEISTVVFDVASVKRPICDTSVRLEIANYVPTHPMAGKSVEDPLAGEADLFHGRPWIVIEGYRYSDWIASYLARTGARIQWMNSADMHDKVVALVSHAIHVSSLSSAIAYGRERDEVVDYGAFTGPAFADITRLADSPVEFWVETLLENRDYICHHLEVQREALQQLKEALSVGDSDVVRRWIYEAKEARKNWRQSQSN